MILKNKREVRRSVMLQTPFERTRMDAHLQQVNMLLLEQKAVLMQQEKQHQHAILQRRKVAKWEGSQRGIGEAHDQQNVLTPRMSFEQHLTDDMLRQLLEKVFRSADEEHAGKNAVIIFSLKSLSITSVRQVVPDEASDFLSGHLPLFQAASSIKIPKLLDMLRDRREKARQRLCSNVKRRATADAMVLLFREELDETFRYSRQDMAFIMQTIPGNDQGEVEYEALPALLHVLRKESINNAVLEVDPIAIEAELNRTAKEVRLPFCTLHTVVIAVLLPRIPQEQYAQRNISLEGFNGAELLQVLLCLSSMNRQGQVVWEEFVAVVQRVLPPLFDTDRIGKMVADAEAQAEFEELRGLSVRDSKQKQRASLAARRRSKLRPASHAQLQFMADDGDQGEPPDRESVEKTLVHLFTVLDDRRKGSVPAQVFVGVMHYWSARNGSGSTSGEAGSPLPLNSVSSLSGGAALAAERRYADIVMSCRLTPAEVTGFVAEAKVDPLVQEISYTEHIKAWVATIFEIR
ncbi:hypothetical protein, conserved [Eimeria acervulina]|uniref:Uncharacterized protein n=1 Tax=Eimeria acervulina TaxID=5801 RepID=U6GLV3_EIMAC|nr:hypothetical protein, conserved [Eimeria acervulina]CDI81155.1 hypothetical protein, conserved [Eimeria acervulina]